MTHFPRLSALLLGGVLQRVNFSIKARATLGVLFLSLSFLYFPPTGAWAASTPVTSDGDVCTIIGTRGADLLRGGPDRDIICGLGGNDEIWGLEGDDVIDGGTGNDRLYGGEGNDLIIGGTGNDILEDSDGDNQFDTRGGGRNRVNAGDGDDTILGGEGVDIIQPGQGINQVASGGGNDVITASDGHDQILAGAGNDVVYSGAGDDVIDGGPGNDRLYGEEGNDLIFGGSGNDTLLDSSGDNEFDTRGGGKNTVTAGDGDDTILGGSGVDEIKTGNGFNTVNAGSGNDIITGGDGVDVILAGVGNDTVNSGLGNDTVDAGVGNDRITSTDGYNQLHGGPGTDRITGGIGADVITSSGGKDVAIGGSGDDTLYTGADSDQLFGDEGDDFLIGGIGKDKVTTGTGTDFCEADRADGQFGNCNIDHWDAIVDEVIYHSGQTLQRGETIDLTYRLYDAVGVAFSYLTVEGIVSLSEDEESAYPVSNELFPPESCTYPVRPTGPAKNPSYRVRCDIPDDAEPGLYQFRAYTKDMGTESGGGGVPIQIWVLGDPVEAAVDTTAPVSSNWKVNGVSPEESPIPIDVSGDGQSITVSWQIEDDFYLGYNGGPTADFCPPNSFLSCGDWFPAIQFTSSEGEWSPCEKPVSEWVWDNFYTAHTFTGTSRSQTHEFTCFLPATTRNGIHEVKFRAVDRSGNFAETEWLEVISVTGGIDSDPPLGTTGMVLTEGREFDVTNFRNSMWKLGAKVTARFHMANPEGLRGLRGTMMHTERAGGTTSFVLSNCADMEATKVSGTWFDGEFEISCTPGNTGQYGEYLLVLEVNDQPGWIEPFEDEETLVGVISNWLWPDYRTQVSEHSFPYVFRFWLCENTEGDGCTFYG